MTKQSWEHEPCGCDEDKAYADGVKKGAEAMRKRCAEVIRAKCVGCSGSNCGGNRHPDGKPISCAYCEVQIATVRGA